MGTFGGCPRVSGGHGGTRLQEVITFMSQVSPGFSKVEAQVFRAELHMGPKSKQKCSEREAGTPGQSLEDRGGSLVSHLAQPAKEQAS